MSGLYEALKQAEIERRGSRASIWQSGTPGEVLSGAMVGTADVQALRATRVSIVPMSRLVAITQPRSIGREKFRALAMRLEYLRKQREFKSVQVTSSCDKEGKSLVAGNLAATLSKFPGRKVLLIEGDLHRPAQTSLFGLKMLPGISEWWERGDKDITDVLHVVENPQLWLLVAGKPCNQPSDILQSTRFAQAFAKMSEAFDWTIVDSPPIQPTIDVNLWSHLVDGALLVVRENFTRMETLKKALESLDDPRLMGIVLNDSSEHDQRDYRYSDSSSQQEKKRL